MACSKPRCSEMVFQMRMLLASSYLVLLAAAEGHPCCNQPCVAPLVKMHSVDARHGFCGESCMDPAKFKHYKVFEPNLTISEHEHPCSQLLTPSNDHDYTDYMQ